MLGDYIFVDTYGKSKASAGTSSAELVARAWLGGVRSDGDERALDRYADTKCRFSVGSQLPKSRILDPAHQAPIMASMAEQLKTSVYEFRTEAGLTQEDLAQKVGVTRQTIIAIEKGNYAPSVALALKLATVLKTTVESLFKI